MTPIQFIEEECANHQHDGSCLGVMINADLSLSGFGPRTRCRVAASERCQYFEECVAPMVNMVTDLRRAAAIQEAVAEYRQVTNQKALAARPCPDCGGACQPRRRYCPNCALKRRKSATRHATAKWRMSCEQLSLRSD